MRALLTENESKYNHLLYLSRYYPSCVSNMRHQHPRHRDNLIMVHTPQTFRFEILKKAHQIAEEKNILATDDASLVENISGKIKFIHGDYDNIKITVQEDLKYLK